MTSTSNLRHDNPAYPAYAGMVMMAWKRPDIVRSVQMNSHEGIHARQDEIVIG